jgi:hypothetical protein
VLDQGLHAARDPVVGAADALGREFALRGRQDVAELADELPRRRDQPGQRAGLAAIAAAAFSGVTFVSNRQDGASMAMAILSGVALLCYLANLLVVSPPATPGSER